MPSANDLRGRRARQLEAQFGRRAVLLAGLNEIERRYGIQVPRFCAVSGAISRHFNDICLGDSAGRNGSGGHLDKDRRRRCYRELVEAHLDAFQQWAETAAPAGEPIIRGSSSKEGYRGLSFAGVCESVRPNGELDLRGHLREAVPRVLASAYSRFSNYYFDRHRIPEEGRNVCIMLMEMIRAPALHGVALVYPQEIRAHYVLAPGVEDRLTGGGFLELKSERNLEEQLRGCPGLLRRQGRRLADGLWYLCRQHYGRSVPLDVEFLISAEERPYIVQLRPISGAHRMNYRASRKFGKKPSKGSQVLGESSYFTYSVGAVRGRLTHWEEGLRMLDESERSTCKPILIVPHQGGEGTLAFLESLPSMLESKVSAIITHPAPRRLDHLQYAIYEDARLGFVAHCDQGAVDRIGEGVEVELLSTGRTVHARRPLQ